MNNITIYIIVMNTIIRETWRTLKCELKRIWLNFFCTKLNYNKIHKSQPLRHNFLTSSEKNYSFIFTFAFLTSCEKNIPKCSFYDRVFKILRWSNSHSMNNKFWERKNLTLKYEFKRIIFFNWFLYMTFPCKLKYQLPMTRGRKTIILITC